MAARRRRGRSAARAQQREQVRRIGVLMNLAADDPESPARLAAFLQGLEQLGWTDGRNVRIDTRWGGGNADQFRGHAAELVGLAPDVILAVSSPAVSALAQVTRTVPIVFVQVGDPVGSGFVASLARPRGNATGFIVVRIRHEREMAGATQADRAAHDESGGPSRSRRRLRDRPVRRASIRGTVAGRGAESGRRAATLARSSVPSRHSRTGRMAA